MGNIKASRKDKEWFAERCGAYFVKIWSGKITKVYDEAVERHGLKKTAENRQKVLQAYRTANPNCKASYADDTYDKFYDAGSESFSASNAEIKRFAVAAGIDKEQKILQIREAILETLEKQGISALDPKIVDVFRYGINLDEILETGKEKTSGDSDEDDEIDEFDAAIKLARSDAGSDGEQEG